MNKIIFFGTEDFSLITLKALVEADFPVVAVVTKPDTPRGRGHVATPPAVKSFALKHNIAVWQPQRLTDITNDIAKFDKPLGVLVSFGKIIPQSIIDLFTPGIINVHPSLLPKYRGPSPIEAAILNGDKETAVSIMQLSAAMDAGPVYGYAPLELTGTEGRSELYDKLGELGAQTLLRLLPLIIDGKVVGLPQDDNQASYCQLITKSDGVIDWNKPAVRIEREIRAYAGWPQSRTMLGSTDVIVTRASIITMDSSTPGKLRIEKDRLFVGTAQDWLEIQKLKPLGKKEMPVAAFLAGYGSSLGV